MSGLEIFIRIRAVPRTIIWGGGGGSMLTYSCYAWQISVQIDHTQFCLQSNLSGRKWYIKYVTNICFFFMEIWVGIDVSAHALGRPNDTLHITVTKHKASAYSTVNIYFNLMTNVSIYIWFPLKFMTSHETPKQQSSFFREQSAWLACDPKFLTWI